MMFRLARRALAPLSLVYAIVAGSSSASAAPKYHFHGKKVEAVGVVSAEAKAAAREALEKDLAGRPELATDVPAASRDELLQTLAARKLTGYDVELKIESVKEELKPPRPGGRLPQLAVSTKVSVFGTTMSDAKMAFSGEGESTIEAEIVERKRAAESAALTKDALTHAVKQAVDEAIQKLARPKAAPMNEGKRKRAKKAAAP